MASPSIDTIAVHGWQALLVVKSSDEMNGMILCKSLLSIGDPPVHGWQDPWGKCNTCTAPVAVSKPYI